MGVFKWLWVLALVLMTMLPVNAQMQQASKDFPAFSSANLMTQIVAQFMMGDQRLLLAAMTTGDATVVVRGSKYMVMQREGDVFQILIGGQPGVWYTAYQFMK